MSAAGPAGRVEPLLLAVTTTALIAGGIAFLTGAQDAADLAWALGAAAGIAPAAGWVVAALRRGQLGADLIAVLALAGTLAVGEYLAGALISVMLATGRSLESAARRRIATHLQQADAAGSLRPDQLEDLLGTLYGLNTVLRLHFAQEEESYFSLAG